DRRRRRVRRHLEVLQRAAARQPTSHRRVTTLVFLLLSSLKWGKLATTGGTMLLSLAVYATIWGWRYAAGFIVLILVHEMGHYIAARQCGLNVGAPPFIPFVGAWIELKAQPMNAEVEAYVAMAGPLLGSI